MDLWDQEWDRRWGISKQRRHLQRRVGGARQCSLEEAIVREGGEKMG